MINNLSFTGRYVLKGKIDQTARAKNTIREMKKDNVDFLQITRGDNVIVIVATDEDKKTLVEKRHKNDLYNEFLEVCKGKKDIIPCIVRHLFGSDIDTLLIQNDTLARFALPTNSIDYSTGANKTKYQKVEKFVDGTIKKYNSKGRLFEITRPDGTVEEIALNGARKITYPDGTVELIGGTIPSYVHKETSVEEKKSKTQKQEKESIVIDDSTLPTAKPSLKHSKPIIPIVIPMEIPENESKAIDYTPIEQSPIVEEVMEEVVEETKIHPLDLAFEKYKDKNGVIDYENETITLPYRDGIKQVLDKNGSLRSFIFPDGTIKNYDRYENITEKIYPDGRIEFFNRSGRPYLMLHPDGTKEYSRLIV
ncbi:MAG: hypothetical protein IJW73_02660 [Candidatus Gastranaerophilales bacterium]|nr:hypothetical protein [Candidatus Gastranaerophilales bacterium]